MKHEVVINSIPCEDGKKYEVFYDGELIGVVCGDSYLNENFAFLLAFTQYDTGDVEGYFPCACVNNDGEIEYCD